jgi:tetraacyldisaccharide 4'-kinase
LREPLSGLRRAHAVALSRADLVEPGEREKIKATVGRHAPRAVWLELAHAPRRLVSSAGQEQSLDGLRGRRVAAFCGIGNPAGFRRTLEGLGAAIADFREFPDHYAYQRADIDSLAAWGDRLGAEALVCTSKDLVKLRVERIGRLPLWSVAIQLEIMTGQSELEALLEPLLP